MAEAVEAAGAKPGEVGMAAVEEFPKRQLSVPFLTFSP